MGRFLQCWQSFNTWEIKFKILEYLKGDKFGAFYQLLAVLTHIGHGIITSFFVLASFKFFMIDL